VETFKPPPSSGLVPDQMHRIVVLISDGAPNGADTGMTACETLAEQKFAAQPPDGPILTFAVGIGDLASSSDFKYLSFMGRVAQKGGTAPLDCSAATSDPAGVCHLQVTPGQGAAATKQAFLDAINKVRALSTSCEFTFTTNDTTDLNNVTVEITDKDGNKSEVPKDDENGWSFDDPSQPSKVVLHGAACSASTGTVSGRVDVVIGCKVAN
jgi:hypothetical protein